MMLKPGKNNKNLKEDIWKGIIHKAEADGEDTLVDYHYNKNTGLRKRYWVGGIAASLLIGLSISFFFYNEYVNKADELLSEAELMQVFADVSSSSRLILSSGDTIYLDGEGLGQGEVPIDLETYLAKDGNSDGLASNMQIVEAGRGKQLQFSLPDGTKVWLNAQSKLEFPSSFSNDLREVQLDGEAYFEVTSSASWPFEVISSEDTVRVLGTHFNVKNYKNEDSFIVTLLEGKVGVNSKGKHENYLLDPSDQLVAVSGEPKASIRKLEDPFSAVAWKDGDFYFQEAGAEEIAQEIERWYPVYVKVKNQDNKKRISGKLKRKGSMQEVVEMLRFFDIEVSVEKRI